MEQKPRLPHADHCNRAWQMPIRIENKARNAGKFGRKAVKMCRFHRHIWPVPTQIEEFRDRN